MVPPMYRGSILEELYIRVAGWMFFWLSNSYILSQSSAKDNLICLSGYLLIGLNMVYKTMATTVKMIIPLSLYVGQNIQFLFLT